MLAVATSPRGFVTWIDLPKPGAAVADTRSSPPALQVEDPRGYIVSGASHLLVTKDARPDRIQRAEPLVTSLCHNSTGDLVSHPNATAHLPRRLLR
jgi:hypothetical protein